jgi:hypothetical protein
MFYLKPPRHISTLPKPEKLNGSICFPLCPQQRTCGDYCGMSELCQQQTSQMRSEGARSSW